MAAEKTVAEMVEEMAAQNGVEDVSDDDFGLAITRLDGYLPDRTVRLLAGLFAAGHVGFAEYMDLGDRHEREVAS